MPLLRQGLDEFEFILQDGLVIREQWQIRGGLTHCNAFPAIIFSTIFSSVAFNNPPKALTIPQRNLSCSQAKECGEGDDPKGREGKGYSGALGVRGKRSSDEYIAREENQHTTQWEILFNVQSDVPCTQVAIGFLSFANRSHHHLYSTLPSTVSFRKSQSFRR
jgi:hypothetical protein